MRFLIRFAVRILPVIVAYVLYAIRKRKASVAREENKKQRGPDAPASEKLWEIKAPLDFVKNITEGGARMEIEELTMEQAKELFHSEQGQGSWSALARIVGPPVEHTFKDDYIMRLCLAAVFGAMLVRRDKTIAEEALEDLKKGCSTNYDKAVWALAAGTFAEVFGDRQEAIGFYDDAIRQYGGTYVAYFRRGKIAYDAEDFATAEKYCRLGVSYLYYQDELYEKDVLDKIEDQFVAFMAAILEKRAEKKRDDEEDHPREITHEKSLEEIWAIEDETDLVIALGLYVAEKCRYGDEMSALSVPERVLYVTQGLEMEVNNGGFDQYFFNSSGNEANEVVAAYMEIGATQVAEICRKAVAIFGGEVPVERFERVNAMPEDEETAEILDECDRAFYACDEEDLIALSYAYVMKNKALFTC